MKEKQCCMQEPNAVKKTLQKIILSRDENKGGLYQKGKNYTFLSCGGVKLEKGGVLTFDTYFNAFSLKKWKKYTNLKNLKFHASMKGCVRAVVTEIYYINRQTYREKESRVQLLTANKRGDFEISVKTESDADAVFLKFYALNENSVFYGGEFFTETKASEVNDICIAMGICTFKREDFVLANIGILKQTIFDKNSPYRDKFSVFVADNGRSLEEEAVSDENIKVYGNENLGGTGGFCRCMLEAFFHKQNGKNFTHMLLMDDDILFEPESFTRLYEFLSLLKEEYKNAMVAFSMFTIEQPTVQYTKGKLREHNVSKCLKHNLDLKYLKNILFNERENVSPNFSGWWCHCIPATYINSKNLPFPFFIRCDDTEYGCRYKNLVLTMNGFGIWHPSFEGKHPISINYYDMRNNLIFMTENINGITKRQLLNEAFIAYKNALYFDYGKAMAAMQGIEDFLKGPQFLETADYVALNENIRKYNYKFAPPPQKYAEILRYVPTRKKKPYSVEALRFFNWFPAFRTKYITCDRRFVSLFGVRKLFCYDPETNLGYYLKKDRRLAWLCRKKFKKLCRQIEKVFLGIVEEWRRGSEFLYTQDFWLNKLGLQPENYRRIETELSAEPYPAMLQVPEKENLYKRMAKRLFPWFTKRGKMVRRFVSTHFTVRSDFGMHARFYGRKLLKIFGLSRFNKNMREMRRFKDIHKGKRCFITCTGPSLTLKDLELLKGEYTIGVNSITKAYPYTDWRPTYYALIDEYAYGGILRREEVFGGRFSERLAFFHYRVRPKTYSGNEIYCPINYSNHWRTRMKKGKVKICSDPAVGLYDCFTVTNMAITLAAYMGFKDIYIVGADATYKLKKTHFIEGEWEKVHKKAQAGLADSVLLSMVGYLRMRNYYNKRGVKIYNATRGGMLDVFPRVDLDTVLAEKKKDEIQ